MRHARAGATTAARPRATGRRIRGAAATVVVACVAIGAALSWAPPVRDGASHASSSAPGTSAPLAALGGLVQFAEAGPVTDPLLFKPNPRAGTHTCEPVAAGDLPFCSMVDYAVVSNETYPALVLDTQAHALYSMMEDVLTRFDCTLQYSLHNCTACRDAYHRWVCATMLGRCDEGTPSGFRRTCLSLCEDVGRKCPYTFQFRCPSESTVDYSSALSDCNLNGRTVYPVEGGPAAEAWPGTFGAAPGRHGSRVAAVVAAGVGGVAATLAAMLAHTGDL